MQQPRRPAPPTQWVPGGLTDLPETDIERNLTAEGGPLSATGWSGWRPIPTGATTDTPAPLRFGGDLHLFVRGTDNGIYWNRLSRRTG
ncbi:MAG TPA: hypothetical protein VK464_04220, partial [Symbiobacteriaceae bacterium]|nr:hypothetical protein [Symbiobacteriaceae bacterium]